MDKIMLFGDMAEDRQLDFICFLFIQSMDIKHAKYDKRFFESILILSGLPSKYAAVDKCMLPMKLHCDNV